MDMISKDDAKGLAVSYAAFSKANMNKPRDIIVWGGILLDDQDKTGIQMYSPELINRLIRQAHHILAEQKEG